MLKTSKLGGLVNFLKLKVVAFLLKYLVYLLVIIGFCSAATLIAWCYAYKISIVSLLLRLFNVLRQLDRQEYNATTAESLGLTRVLVAIAARKVQE